MFSIIFNHHPPPENVVYCQYIKKKQYAVCQLVLARNPTPSNGVGGGGGGVSVDSASTLRIVYYHM